MSNQYSTFVQELEVRIEQLQGRAERFSKHPTLHTRVPGVLAEIEALQAKIGPNVATDKWVEELR